jgi:F0F1-type ATP synthase assembly protein I
MTSRLSEGDRSSNPPGSNQKSDEKYRIRLQQLRAASVGWNFITAPFVGGGLGYSLDWFFSTYPWVMIVGVILGFVSAFIELLRISR